MRDVPPYFAFWGKSRKLESTMISHPAVFHMLDVAASARAWLLSNKPYIPGLGSWDNAYLPTILFLIALHDIGKFSRPFQAKRPELWPPELGDIVARPEPRHDVAGYALLEFSAFDDRLAPLLPSLDYGDKAYLWRAICGHHGRPPSEGRIDSRTFCLASQAAALSFVDDLLDLLKPTPLPVQNTDLAALSWWLSGLTVISDWIGSAEDWFPYPVPLISLGDYSEAAILAAGYAPAIGFLHTGKPQSFAYDIADIFKFDTVVPEAFAVVAAVEKGKLLDGEHVRDPVAHVRRRCRNSFRSKNLLARLIPTIEEILSAGGLSMPEPPDEAQPVAFADQEGLSDVGHRG